MSTVDVVVPCYRYGHFLGQCVDSVLDQGGPTVRVLIIDDASPDNTYEVATELARSDSRIVVLRHTSNRGHIATYNEGIEWATADYFLLLSADDWLLPGALARADAVLSHYPDVVLTCGHALLSNPNSPAPAIPEQSCTNDYKVISGPEFIRAACFNASAAPVWTPTAIVRTKTQKIVGGYTDSLPHTGDLEMWLRLASRGSVAILTASQAVYREHQLNMHHSFTKLENLREHLRAFDSAFRRNEERIPHYAQLVKQYKRSMAIKALQLADQALLEGKSECYKKSLEFAITVLPEIIKSSHWYQTRVKRILGCTTVNAMKRLARPALRLLRSD
jgi:glycosyltransferase involved in cell wall biosynthesis